MLSTRCPTRTVGYWPTVIVAVALFVEQYGAVGGTVVVDIERSPARTVDNAVLPFTLLDRYTSCFRTGVAKRIQYRRLCLAVRALRHLLGILQLDGAPSQNAV